ncbi:MAG: hypothetical protein GF353_28600 [Candidatus Lokiarchaeota archaeon]|nr:hypothetical protein [Candidatus Lokiarchaeota archaeon]MBD3353963.1 hypothetical protein [Candidatus Lokiarchaeota archaeon]
MTAVASYRSDDLKNIEEIPGFYKSLEKLIEKRKRRESKCKKELPIK